MSRLSKSEEIRQNRLLALETARRLVEVWLPLFSPVQSAEELGNIVVDLAARFEDYIVNGAPLPEEE